MFRVLYLWNRQEKIIIRYNLVYFLVSLNSKSLNRGHTSENDNTDPTRRHIYFAANWKNLDSKMGFSVDRIKFLELERKISTQKNALVPPIIIRDLTP